MLVTMFFVSIMVFSIMELPPGDYADRYAYRKFSGASIGQVTEADLRNIRHKFGLDRPWYQRYFSWIWGIASRFDFGPAFAFETSVNRVIGQRLWLSLAIMFSTLIVTYMISIPIGIYAAVHRHSIADYSLTVFSYLGLALPNFLLGLVLLYIAVTVFGSSVGGFFSPGLDKAPWSFAKAVDLLKHLFVPAVVLAWSATALQAQTMRATMLDEINKLSVTTARARGLPEWKLLLKYPARLAINPVAGSIGFDINRIFSDLPIVALVLGLPELGELLIKSYLDLDMYVAGAILLLITFIIIFLNFLSDILLAVLDPRIKLEGG
ncbi:MAG: ABC transporter permease [Deltaproteobacteria bacterium]|nr:ABC transporter permease [Deltaproteobacteria bacterium]MBM4428941.1 ABC transporter permease [Chloroflexota bacterium]